jgi:hypothetical protein
MAVTFPNLSYKNVTIRRIRNQGMTVSPFSKHVKITDWGVAQWGLRVELPPLVEGDPLISTMLTFLEDVDGIVETFDVDISRYVPHLTGPVVVTFRMNSPNFDYGMDDQRLYNFSFEATEVVA